MPRYIDTGISDKPANGSSRSIALILSGNIDSGNTKPESNAMSEYIAIAMPPPISALMKVSEIRMLIEPHSKTAMINDRVNCKNAKNDIGSSIVYGAGNSNAIITTNGVLKIALTILSLIELLYQFQYKSIGLHKSYPTAPVDIFIRISIFSR